tara:strand:- start:1028 stop:1186 length:159 start_codon:yes stop_codon:yes gene_type:complete
LKTKYVDESIKEFVFVLVVEHFKDLGNGDFGWVGDFDREDFSLFEKEELLVG